MLKRAVHWTVVLFCLLSLLFLSSCHRSEAPQKKETIHIGIIYWPGFFPLLLAQIEHLYENEGISVDVKIFPDNPSLNKALADGEIQIAGSVYCDAIQMRSRGIPVQVIAAPDYSNTADAILAKPNIKSPSELKGKRISFEKPNSFSHLFISEFVRLKGIPETEVTYSDVSAADVLKALEKNEIDAGHTWDPVLTEGLKKGYKIIGYAGQTPGIITETLIILEPFGKAHNIELKKILKCFFEAQKYIINIDSSKIAKMQPFFNQTAEEMISYLNQVILADLKQNHRAFENYQDYTSLYESGKHIIEQMNRRGQVSTPIHLQDILNSRYLPEAP